MKTEQVNPFQKDVKWSTYETIKHYIMFPLVMPIKLIIVILTLLLINLLTRIAFLGYKPKKTKGFNHPIPPFRKFLIDCISVLFRFVLLLFGFWHIKVKGKKATKKEAPIFVVNHLSAFDGFITAWIIDASPLARSESSTDPLLAPLFNSVETIFVDRTSHESRKESVEEINFRINNKELDYRQVLIFPEGTTTNGKALITFKNGAFYHGVPVQPVLLRYPFQNFDLAWPPGVGGGMLLLRALSQFVNHCEVEFLEPYIPNEEEKKNPTLYANNVRQLMAGKLKVGTTNQNFQDSLLLSDALLKNPNFKMDFTVPEMIELFNLKFEKERNDFTELLKVFQSLDKDGDSKLSLSEFQEAFYQISLIATKSSTKLRNNDYAKQIFELMDHKEQGYIDFREFILGFRILSKPDSDSMAMIKFAFEIYDTDGDKRISFEELKHVLALNSPDEIEIEKKAKKMFESIDVDKDGSISFDEFLEASKTNKDLINMAREVVRNVIGLVEKKE